MMRVVIMGAHGMLGQALVRAFRNNPLSLPLAKGEKVGVLAWDRDDCDITDRNAAQKKIANVRPSIIINAAAYNDVDRAETHTDIANRVNGDAVGYLAQAAAKVRATFVHYSTDYVFDGTKKEGYREDDTPNPISAYGKSKFLGEEKIQNSEFRIQNYYLIRTSRLFGKPGSGKKSFVDLMIAHARTNETIEVIDEEISSPTYVEDLAVCTRTMIEQKKPSGIYHVTNGGACTWYGFAQEIRSLQWAPLYAMVPIVKPVSASYFPRPAKRPAFSQLLNTKLLQMRPWQEALHAYLVTQRFTL